MVLDSSGILAATYRIVIWVYRVPLLKEVSQYFEILRSMTWPERIR